jgi:RNA polymerase sigma-70 factor, ECF subfamily
MSTPKENSSKAPRQAQSPGGEPHAQDRHESAQLSAAKGVNSQVSSLALSHELLAGRAVATEPAVGAVRVGLSGSGAAALSDTELMLRVKAGDDEAFNILIERFRRPLIGFMYRMAHNQSVAEELAQEVFLRVYRSRQTYAAEAKFSTWLYRIATNLGLNHVRDTRAERMQASVSLDEPDEETGRTLDAADPHRAADEEMIRRERMAAIRGRVDALPEKQRMAVLMHKYQEMDYREIAAVLKMSESATKSLLFRAYETLRVTLRDFV